MKKKLCINICDYDMEFFFLIFSQIFDHYSQQELACKKKNIIFLKNKINSISHLNDKYYYNTYHKNEVKKLGISKDITNELYTIAKHPSHMYDGEFINLKKKNKKLKKQKRPKKQKIKNKKYKHKKMMI